MFVWWCLTPLSTMCQQHQLQLTPQIFFTDFDTAIRNSAQRAFTQATLKNCFFHYAQCIWWKTQKLGLTTAYRDNDNVRLFVRRAAVLPITTDVVSSNLGQGEVYNIILYSLSVTCDRSVVFSGSSGFLHQ